MLQLPMSIVDMVVAQEVAGLPCTFHVTHPLNLLLFAGYTGPLCASCSSGFPPLSASDEFHLQLGLNTSSLTSVTGIGKKYARYRSACRECPANRTLSLLAYIGARFVDLAVVAALVALVVRERNKRMHKQAKSVLHAPKVAAPGGGLAQNQHRWPPWAEQLLPSWLRSNLAVVPLLRRERGPVPKRPEIAADALVQVCFGRHAQLVWVLSHLLPCPASAVRHYSLTLLRLKHGTLT